MVSVCHHSDENKTITNDQLIAALKIHCSDRTDIQIDTILQSAGQWPCFMKAIKSEQMRREVCRHAVLEEKEQSSILFKQGDLPNGWFILISGQVCVVQYDTSDAAMMDMSAEMIKKLKEGAGDHFYRLVTTLGPKSSIGETALIQDKTRNATIYVAQHSYFIRIDSQVYKDTAAFFQKMQLKRRANLFASVKEFKPISEYSYKEDKIQTIAENTDEYSIPSGTVIDKNHCDVISMQTYGKKEETDVQKTQSIYVIAVGKLELYRNVNFSKYNTTKASDKQKLFKEVKLLKRYESDVLKVRRPTGVHSVQVAVLEAGDVFPDPRLAGGWVPYQFSLKAIEPTVVHGIRINDLSAALPISILDKIKENVTNQPTNQEIIESWIEKQKNVQWNAYKKDCVKEARRNAKIQRDVMNNNYGLRKPGIPKSLKEYVVTPISKNSHSPSFVKDYNPCSSQMRETRSITPKVKTV